MVWGRAPFAFLCGLAVACGPGGSATPDTDGETDTDTDTEGTTGDSDPTNPTATNPATSSPTATNASNSGSTTTTDTGPVDSGDSDTSPPTTGECPYGTEGCLCDVGAMCDEGLSCSDEGICEAPPACRPLDRDPHGDEASAYELDPLGCGDGMDLGIIATLEGPETDWYTHFGGEAFQCPEQPAATAMALGIATEVCVYIECVEGNAVGVMCGNGSGDATSPDGRPGCCGEDAAQISGYDCMGQFAGKDVDVWISVGTDEEACADYALSYAF